MAKDKKPSTNGNNGRNAKGQFVKGNRGGPGNPFAAQMARNRSLIVETVGEDKLAQIVERLAADAIEGDNEAAKILLGYCAGKPVQPVEHTGEGGGPVKVVTEIEIVSGSND